MFTRSLLASAALAGALASTAGAEVLFVPDNAPTIQSAIEMAAPAGDTIFVWPGTYPETVSFLGKEVAVRSLAGPGLTIIDGEGQGTVVSFGGGVGPDAVLDGFTITGGEPGIRTAAGTSPTLTGCVVRANLGGAVLYGETQTLYGCVFEGNAAEEGGGITFWGRELTLIDCIFDGNTASGVWGSALMTRGEILTVRNCTFTRNASAQGYAPAIMIEPGLWSTVTLIDTVFSDNVGAGIDNFSNYGGYFLISGCRFSDNIGGGATAPDVYTHVEDSEFTNNTGRGLALRARATVKRSVFSSNSGGGVYIWGPDLSHLESCVFTDNTAGSGAAVWGEVRLDGCTFIGNHATGSGGAVRSVDTVEISDCEFRENTAGGMGGAIHAAYNCSANRSIFEDNEADVGGALATGGPGSLVDCEFTGNTARRGGALHLASEYDITTLTRCRVSGNVAAEEGGGILSEAPFVATNCVINGNVAAAGGGVHATGSTDGSSYVNCLFTENTADTGGGLHLSSACEPMLVNTTFFGNTAASAGGALFCGESNSPTLANCILWGNHAPAGHEISNASGDTLSIRYSNIEDCGGSGGEWDKSLGADAGGNIDVDPLFVDAPTTLRLGSGSPCIDAADNGAVPPGVTTDVTGLPRFVDDPLTTDTGAGDPPLVDMGAHEFPAACVGDIDEDGRAGFSDLLAILAAWGNVGGPEDLDGSGVVDFGDVIVVLAAWGVCA